MNDGTVRQMLLETPCEMAVHAAERFRNIRKRKKITIKALSGKSGVPYSTIRRFESKGEISFLSLVKIVSAIGEDDQITGLFSDVVPASIEEVIRENRR
ncbi:MAG: helix-turn-helix transcriptional regulator [Clostridia bacterium]|nr:helix-turn-helix transcriptional regulator [Clostridia bacterium]